MNGVTAYLLMTNVSPATWLAPVWQRSQIIGRHPQCDIVIPSEYVQVSRRHAAIESTHNEMWIQDLGSSRGSNLNGVPLVPDTKTFVVIGDRLSLGGLEVFFVSPEASVITQAGNDDPNASQNARTSQRFYLGAVSIDADGVRQEPVVPDLRLHCLTPAELEVLRWFCRGLAVKEISQTLFRSPHTVKTQLNSIYKKLGVHSRAELLSFFKLCDNAWTKSHDPDNPPTHLPPPTSIGVPEPESI